MANETTNNSVDKAARTVIPQITVTEEFMTAIKANMENRQIISMTEWVRRLLAKECAYTGKLSTNRSPLTLKEKAALEAEAAKLTALKKAEGAAFNGVVSSIAEGVKGKSPAEVLIIADNLKALGIPVDAEALAKLAALA